MNQLERLDRIEYSIMCCQEVIDRHDECSKCREEHQHLKECLELTLEVIPLLETVPELAVLLPSMRSITTQQKITKDTRPICPDCKQVMVKTNIELTDGWFTGWGCECRDDPK